MEYIQFPVRLDKTGRRNVPGFLYYSDCLAVATFEDLRRSPVPDEHAQTHNVPQAHGLASALPVGLPMPHGRGAIQSRNDRVGEARSTTPSVPLHARQISSTVSQATPDEPAVPPTGSLQIPTQPTPPVHPAAPEDRPSAVQGVVGEGLDDVGIPDAKSFVDKQKRKPGNQGDFRGRRFEFLNAQLPAYSTASAAKTVTSFYRDTLFPAYFRKFPYRYGIDQEPPEDIEDQPVEDDSKLSIQERKDKSEAMQSIMKKIRHWFNYRRNLLGINSGKDPWAPFLADLRRTMGPAPRRHSEVHFFMHDGRYKGRIEEALMAQYPNLSTHE
ncbi:hypothetical protein HGRIS_014833 [Hohenbuehelia grisea]|uniref:Uncharacterized protein n=1 Tax=Hohenbuehelia grisea TaxID=104357 RepID=A0ABR3IQW6_9AGAR